MKKKIKCEKKIKMCGLRWERQYETVETLFENDRLLLKFVLEPDVNGLVGCKRVIVSLRTTSVARRRIELAFKLEFQDEGIE